MPVMPMPSNVKVSSIAGLRPMRSPMRPIKNAPIGRIRKPTPNVAREAKRLIEGSSDGKNVRPI
jgi:hypothetical protein